jgi:hypothetical protein
MEKESEHKEEILELLKKASSDDYETQWDDKGVPIPKSKAKIKEGKKSKKSGGDFELKVRKDLEDKGWVVAKWSNNVDLELKKLISAKKGMVFNPFFKRMMPTISSTGFPDFVAFQLVGERVYNVIGVESKINGTLSKEEKDKCVFLLNNKIFNEIWIAQKNEETKKVEYINFRERFEKLFSL